MRHITFFPRHGAQGKVCSKREGSGEEDRSTCLAHHQHPLQGNFCSGGVAQTVGSV